MKTLAALTFATALVAGLALPQTRRISLVKGSPTNYGTNGFDISWVDNRTEKYYLDDRTNNAIDLVDADTDTFLGFIGKGQYTGSKPCPAQPKDLRHCSGPNGVLTDNLGHVWAGDGAGNIIEPAQLNRAQASFGRSQTGGKFRVDELAYDPIDQILMASSDGDSPPFLTFVSVKDGSVLGQYKYPVEQDGMEQPAWVRQTGWFYQNVPGAKNRIDVFGPHKLPNPVMSFPVKCTGGALGLTLSGLEVGPSERLMTVCGSVGGVSLDSRSGRIQKTIPEGANSDQVWYDLGSNSYYFAHADARGQAAGGSPAGVVSVVNAATEQFVEDIRFEGAGVHSVAVSARNNHIFVPVNGKGIFVVAPGQ
jgi:hypothetical protein